MPYLKLIPIAGRWYVSAALFNGRVGPTPIISDKKNSIVGGAFDSSEIASDWLVAHPEHKATGEIWQA